MYQISFVYVPIMGSSILTPQKMGSPFQTLIIYSTNLATLDALRLWIYKVVFINFVSEITPMEL